MKKAIIYWFGFLSILLWMTSCATRKVQKNITDNSTQKTEIVEQTNAVKTNFNNSIITNNDVTANGEVTSEKVTITPIDTRLPIVFTDRDGTSKRIKNGTFIKEIIKTKSNVKDLTKSTKIDNKLVVDQTQSTTKTDQKTEDKTT